MNFETGQILRHYRLVEKIDVIGGKNGSAAGGFTRATVYVLDPITLDWTFGPEMITPRHGFAAALGDDRYIYVMGGSNDSGGTHLVERLETIPDCNYRGSLANLHAGAGETCYKPDLPAAGVAEEQTPQAGAGWFYVVSGENGAGEGPLGQASDGSPRLPAALCP